MKSVDKLSRRLVIHTMAGAIGASTLLRTSRVHADEKKTRAQVEYRDTPNGIYSCGNCSLFERPKSCKVVEGEISEDGWCTAFALVD